VEMLSYAYFRSRVLALNARHKRATSRLIKRQRGRGSGKSGGRGMDHEALLSKPVLQCHWLVNPARLTESAYFRATRMIANRVFR
jgi:hypothetical protein